MDDELCDENDNATPVKAWAANINNSGWTLTVLAHDGHFHVGATQNTGFHTYDEALEYCENIKRFMYGEWHDVTHVLPDSAQALRIQDAIENG